ncbi:MICOS complex subunit MIC19 [Amphibalanus amphitrite]|uniref:MICOS complex subunit MIC19 n=1 Tax=Amphibalanus amphitrite TaxID=1232801 RepID=A0A6A4VU17_AMPAM|nr:MICOS complex subunit MIC19 [Amphibalanus amphitrite]
MSFKTSHPKSQSPREEPKAAPPPASAAAAASPSTGSAPAAASPAAGRPGDAGAAHTASPAAGAGSLLGGGLHLADEAALRRRTPSCARWSRRGATRSTIWRSVHAEQHGLTTEAFHRTLAEVQGLFLKASTTPICQDGQERVMNCYSDNPKQSLKCAKEVQQFSECVDLTRLNRLMR